MRRNRKGGHKLFLLGALLCFIVTMGLFFSHSGKSTTDYRSTKKSSTISLPVEAEDALRSLIHMDVESFEDRIFILHNIQQQLALLDDEHELVERILHDCGMMSQAQQLQNVTCTGLWMHRLVHEPITAVDRWWGFGDTHFGAITLQIGSMKAMFKPCTSLTEDTTKEIVSSRLDLLLGWGQTAPAITRLIRVKDIEKFVQTPEDQEAFEETLECAKNGYFVGPMIGWWNDLIPIRTRSKREKKIPQLMKWRRDLSDRPLIAKMESKFHAYYLLVNVLRHGKDEFITQGDGTLVSLDLDRSRFSSTPELKDPAVNYTWCYTCYMDKWTYDTLSHVGPSQPEQKRLGYLMKEMLELEPINNKLWNRRMAEALDRRVERLLECIDSCIDKYGAENVLIDQVPPMSTKEIVSYFVLNSEYKDFNGRRGPSDIIELLGQLDE